MRGFLSAHMSTLKLLPFVYLTTRGAGNYSNMPLQDSNGLFPFLPPPSRSHDDIVVSPCAADTKEPAESLGGLSSLVHRP